MILLVNIFLQKKSLKKEFIICLKYLHINDNLLKLSFDKVNFGIVSFYFYTKNLMTEESNLMNYFVESFFTWL